MKSLPDVLDKAITALVDICGALTPRTSIPPNIPVRIEALLFQLLPNLRAGDAFVVTIIPLADVLGYFNLGIAWNWVGLALAVTLPWQRTLKTKV